MTRTVAVVPHVHWDREWYLPFQRFRLRLVALLDDLLPRLETGDAAPFLLDGQVAALDDYLAVRPEAEATVRRLVEGGHLSIGPWYALMDEFCVSGETIVRNLELGLERATALGGAMEVGYLPDMFGHVAQMPQLLRQAGFEHAVVWRGVPSAVDRTAFWWSAPDGSTVRAEYLPVGYANGAAVPPDAPSLLSRVRDHEVELGPLLGDDTPLLWMNGGDHQVPQPWLTEVVTEADRASADYRIGLTTLPSYLAAAPTTDLPAWAGELRSGARANLLMGVLSNRVDVKQAAARAEMALERLAEPLCALFLAPARWPAGLLRLAWTDMARNSAHDSSCACSVDEVGRAVLHRYAEAAQVGEGLAASALDALGASMSVSGPVVVNPAQRTSSGLVEVLLAGDGPIAGSQVLDQRPAATTTTTVTGGQLSMLIGRVVNDQSTHGCRIVDVQAGDDGGGPCVRIRTGVATAGAAGVEPALAHLYAWAGARRHSPVRVTLEQEPFQRVLARVDDVAGFGWKAWQPRPLSVEAVAVDGHAMDNRLVRVAVDPADGTFCLDGVGGLDRLVDDGDAGDTYNHCPPSGDLVVRDPAAVRVEVEEDGPLRAVLRVVRTFEWPEAVVDGDRTGRRTVEVTTRLELRAGEPLVRVTTSLDNRCRDHRLRAWFPLPRPATTSRAECAFAVVERGLEAEGGPHEQAMATFPSRRFVTAGGLTVVHQGLLEYELVDGGAALAVTLLRATGLLSGTDLSSRPMPAGPPLPAHDAQMPGPQVFRYAVALADSEGARDPYALADAFLPLQVTAGSGLGHRPAAGSALTVEGAEVSAVRRVEGGVLEVRVFNPSPVATTARMVGRSGWLVDLRGRRLAAFEESFPVSPWGIATARLH